MQEKLEQQKNTKFQTAVEDMTKYILDKMDTVTGILRMSIDEFWQKWKETSGIGINSLAEVFYALAESGKVADWKVDTKGESFILLPANMMKFQEKPVKEKKRKIQGKCALGGDLWDMTENREFYALLHDRKESCVIEKIIELKQEDFDLFSQNIACPNKLLEKNQKLQYKDSDNRYHCILLKSENSKNGIAACRINGRLYTGYVPSLEEFQQEMEEIQNTLFNTL